jgi:molecular chaperone DnaJ
MSVAASKDYYEVLGVPRTASDKEVRAAYRKLARKFHPDLNPGDKAAEERFKQISEAYEVLNDPEKRRKYDSFGADWEMAGAGGGAPGGFTFRQGGGTGGGGEPGGVAFDFDLDDLLGGIGGFFGGKRTEQARGQDLHYEIEITLEEAFSGGERRLTLTAPETCPTCQGSGAEPGARFETCTVCRGSGRRRAAGGLTIGGGVCERCGGTGQVPSQPCHTCRGRGVVERPRTVTVTIPKGVDNGTRLRLAGQGYPGDRGGTAGDLYLTIKIRPHAVFERKGDALYVDLPVTFAEAALGAEVEVPTVTGKVSMKLPPGVQSGQQLRLRGQGMHRRAGSQGDLFARIKITVPKNLTDEERTLVEQLQQLRSENPRERLLAGR